MLYKHTWTHRNTPTTGGTYLHLSNTCVHSAYASSWKHISPSDFMSLSLYACLATKSLRIRTQNIAAYFCSLYIPPPWEWHRAVICDTTHFPRGLRHSKKKRKKIQHVFPITSVYYQITPIDGERSGAMVCTVCVQQLMKRPNHTSLIMESSRSRKMTELSAIEKQTEDTLIARRTRHLHFRHLAKTLIQSNLQWKEHI